MTTEDKKIKARIRAAAHYAANKEKRKAQMQARNSANPVVRRAEQIKHRALRRHPDCLGTGFTLESTYAVCEEAIALELEYGIDFHIDHIIPIAAGGKHEAGNLQACSGAWNKAKHDRLDQENVVTSWV